MPQPALNWKEIAVLADGFASKLEGLFVDRIVVPERDRFASGYLKGEWAIRLTGRRSEGTLLFSIRARHPYFVFTEGKGPRAASRGTRSPFDLELTKLLKGQRLARAEVIPRERTVIFWFGSSEGDLGLVLVLVPAAPEALLVRGRDLAIITRSRVEKNNSETRQTHFIRPDGSKAPPDPPVRTELVSDPARFARALEKELDAEAFTLRLAAALREVRDKAKQCRERMRQSETAIQEAERDRDWQRFGDLLKASMHEEPALEPGPKKGTWVRNVRSYETEERVALPADPQLDLSRQVEKYYQLARRKARRISEARSRLESLRETLVGLDLLLAREPEAGDWKALEKLERAAGMAKPEARGDAGAGAKGGKKAGAWLGKTVLSRDGLQIFVGRSRDENLELTFKHARGNDIWMHVRGRPGAHVVVPLQPGKSAPLETLLDAATLTIYYSGGESWGTTEVDYTFKKHVKRIKDSTEASYTHNKTLLVQPDPERIKRLLSGP